MIEELADINEKNGSNEEKTYIFNLPKKKKIIPTKHQCPICQVAFNSQYLGQHFEKRHGITDSAKFFPHLAVHLTPRRSPRIQENQNKI